MSRQLSISRCGNSSAGRTIAVFAVAVSLLGTRAASAQTTSHHPESAPQSREPITVQHNDLHTVTFARLVLQLKSAPRIRVSDDDFRILFIGELRRLGYPALGFESVVFAQDNSSQARFEVGGTVSELSCEDTRPNEILCDIGINWELFDRKRRTVVYKVFTRAIASGSSAEQVGQALAIGAFRSLLSREKFVESLKKVQAAHDSATNLPLHYMACPGVVRKMPEEADAALNGIVVIETEAGFGSGIVVSPDGAVLTAAHVVETDGDITIHGRGGSATRANVVRTSYKYDVALIAPKSKTSASCLPMRITPTSVGEDLYAMGSPASRELSFSITRGIVSAVRTIDGVPLIQTDASVNPGNSGGPLLDAQGRVVGVVSWKLAGKAIEGVAFGVPVSTALQALNLVVANESDAALFAATQSPKQRMLPVIDAPDPPQATNVPRRPSNNEWHYRPEPSSGMGLRIGGIITASVGAAIVGLSWGSYESNKSKGLVQSDFDQLRMYNDFGWASLIAGGGLIVSSYLFYPSRPKPQDKGQLRLGVGPGNVLLQGSY